MIEVFKTDIQEPAQVQHVVAVLVQHFPDSRINIDLHDCDKVLRIEGSNFLPGKIMMLLNEQGFRCAVLE
ncbi:MAG: hypothetical protein ABIU63_02160 [Chitinophagaceae bacterium]